MAPGANIDYDVAYSHGCSITDLEDGRVDIGFCTRWYSSLEIIRSFITNYPDAEWWINQDDVDIYHYYWQDGEVIEDIHQLTEEEDEYLTALMDQYDEAGDESNHYDMIFTEKEDQRRYVNFHPDKKSDAYKAYLETVRRIALQIVDEGRFYALKQYNYEWSGAYRYYGTNMGIRTWYLYQSGEDLSRYKLNIMSADVLDEVQRAVFPYNQKLYHAIFGLAIGDALGVPYEFRQRDTFKCSDMVGHGTHDQPVGTWSDDTSMTLATLKSLKDNNGKVVIEDIRKNFLAWVEEKAFTANGDVFDIGNATYTALTTGRPCVGERDNGNGSLMRILPLAFVDCTDDEIREVSGITHGHWISKEACVIYVHVARRLLAGERIQDIIPTLKYDKPFDRLSRINELDRTEIKSSGYVVSTLEAALWAISHIVWNEDHTAYNMKDYGYDVMDAVNLGSDTDTVAAVTGGLAGIIYGLGYEGERWFKKLRNKEQILDCLWE